MKDWFETLDSREQIFVISGGTVALIALLYAFIWVPLDKGHKALESSVAAWERSLAELRPLRGMQQAGRTTGPSAPLNTNQTPVVIVDQSLRARGLGGSLKRSQPTTSSGIRVEFEGVAFDDLVLWLDDLSTQYAMQVAAGSMSTAARAGPGRVNATLTLERAL
ncbi:MAG: type II secretion system protein M [Gammaproteobacteria bacterium]|nr:type II secretion system protein M [Gammaproteobacteria bacterium]MDH3373813.1 type II secretion system protein M [Gammaproteobacteria bacterium]MDH3408488.1 type II secretion system protein M [Gammaproteobacteria bacterium]